MTPTKPGFYWARNLSYEWFNLIVEVVGEAPFFKCRAWVLSSDKMGAIDPSSIREWGPEIVRPDSKLIK